MFTWSVTSSKDGYTIAELVVEGRVIGKTISDCGSTNDFNPSSATAVVNVNAGDLAYIRVSRESHCYIVSDPTWVQSTFSGWMLFETE